MDATAKSQLLALAGELRESSANHANRAGVQTNSLVAERYNGKADGLNRAAQLLTERIEKIERLDK